MIEALGYAPGDDGRYVRCRSRPTRPAGQPARPSPAASPFAALRGLRLMRGASADDGAPSG